mgnify:FL=1
MVEQDRPTGPAHRPGGAARPRTPWLRRQTVVQIVTALVILVSGMGIGVGGTILALRDRIVWKFPPPPGGGRRWDPNDIARRWQEDYGLTDEQVQQVRDTFSRQFRAMREVFEDLQVREKEQREQFVASMESILTPEQFEKWDKEFRERTERWRRMRPFGRPGRHGPPGRHRRDGRGREDWRDRREDGPRDMRRPGPPPDDAPESVTPPRPGNDATL